MSRKMFSPSTDILKSSAHPPPDQIKHLPPHKQDHFQMLKKLSHRSHRYFDWFFSCHCPGIRRMKRTEWTQIHFWLQHCCGCSCQAAAKTEKFKLKMSLGGRWMYECQQLSSSLIPISCHDKHFFGACKVDAKDTENLTTLGQIC